MPMVKIVCKVLILIAAAVVMVQFERDITGVVR